MKGGAAVSVIDFRYCHYLDQELANCGLWVACGPSTFGKQPEFPVYFHKNKTKPYEYSVNNLSIKTLI
jgi:hypothetical protein